MKLRVNWRSLGKRERRKEIENGKNEEQRNLKISKIVQPKKD